MKSLRVRVWATSLLVIINPMLTDQTSTYDSLLTSILKTSDEGLQAWLSIPFRVSWTGSQLLAKVLFNHTQVI